MPRPVSPPPSIPPAHNALNDFACACMLVCVCVCVCVVCTLCLISPLRGDHAVMWLGSSHTFLPFLAQMPCISLLQEGKYFCTPMSVCVFVRVFVRVCGSSTRFFLFNFFCFWINRISCLCSSRRQIEQRKATNADEETLKQTAQWKQRTAHRQMLQRLM